VKLVYVAGPLSRPDNPDECDPEKIAAACRAAHEVLEAGFAVYLPHLWAHEAVVKRPAAEWLRQDFAVIERCDFLYRMPGQSAGADREVQHAREHHVVVVHSVSALRFLGGFFDGLEGGDRT